MLIVVQHNINEQHLVAEQLREYYTKITSIILVLEPPMNKNGLVADFEGSRFRTIARGPWPIIIVNPSINVLNGGQHTETCMVVANVSWSDRGQIKISTFVSVYFKYYLWTSSFIAKLGGTG